MKINVTEEYLLNSQAQKFCDLCDPLVQNTVIGVIYYYRIYKDGGYFHYSNNKDVTEYLFSETEGRNIFDHRLFDKMFDKAGDSGNRMRIFTADVAGDDDGTYWVPMYKKFDIKNVLTIIEKCLDYYEIYLFVAKPGKNGHSFFMNQLDILDGFILYFKENAQDLIHQGEEKRIIWFNEYPEYGDFLSSFDEVGALNEKIIDIKEKLKLKKYPLVFGDLKIHITESELNCLKRYAQGFSYKEIGNILDISHRTVEAHISNIRKKLGGCSGIELSEAYRANADLITA